MQETRKALIKDEWVVCSKCGHKLGKVIEGQSPRGIEIKCHSCKEINIVNKPRKYTVKASKSARQYKYPHCNFCEYYKPFTDTCIIKWMSEGINKRGKACNSRSCTSFKPKEEYKENYKELNICKKH